MKRKWYVKGSGEATDTVNLNYSAGWLVSESSAGTTVENSVIDPRGRVWERKQTTNGVTPYVFQHEYNRAGNVVTTKYPSGHVAKTSYDRMGRPVGMSGGVGSAWDGRTWVRSVSYEPMGAMGTLSLAGNLSEVRTYPNARLAPESIEARSGTNVLRRIGLTYLNNDNVDTQTISGTGLGALRTQGYQYDGLNRLTQVSETGSPAAAWSQTYDYDRYGNGVVVLPSGLPLTGLTPQAVAGTDPGLQFNGNHWNGVTYDPAGNQKSGLATTDSTGKYDAENRLVSVTNPSVAVAQYRYDGEGRRVLKVVCPTTAACAPGDSGAETTVYVYDAAGELGAEYGTTEERGTQYLFTDWLGSTRLVTDEAGGVKSALDYSPFGVELQSGLGGRTGLYPGGGYPTTGISPSRAPTVILLLTRPGAEEIVAPNLGRWSGMSTQQCIVHFRSDREPRIRHAGEQYWRTLRPALRRNRRPPFDTGHFARGMMPAASRANCCQMASIRSAGR